MEGLVVRKAGPMLEVFLPEEGKRLLCRARIKLIKRKGPILVGDRVTVRPLSETEGLIESVSPRKTYLPQPAVANVDRAFVVFSYKQPDLQLMALDTLLVAIEAHEVEPVVVFNKMDLLDEVERKKLERIGEVYRKAGYEVLYTSAVTGEGLPELKAAMRDRVSVLAGPSGVGKSKLLNALIPGARLRTGEVSERTGRGRHTTTETTLLALPDGGFVADTPGFSRVELGDFLEPEDLKLLFPEFARHAGQCRFPNCTHLVEPDCAVREAVARGEIAAFRYEHYQTMFLKLQEARQERYRRKR